MVHIQLREEYYTMNLLQNLPVVILVFTDHNNNSSETKIN